MLDKLFCTPIEWSLIKDERFIEEINNLYEECENKNYFNHDWMPNTETASFTYLSTEGDVIGDNEYLRIFIERKCESYLDSLNANYEKVILRDSWFAKQEPGQMVGVHDHRELHTPQSVSGVFYVKTLNDPNQGQIIFLSHNPYSGQFPSNIKSLNYCGEVFYPPEQNKMFFFPSTLKHKVTVNNTDTIRVVMSYNLEII